MGNASFSFRPERTAPTCKGRTSHATQHKIKMSHRCTEVTGCSLIRPLVAAIIAICSTVWLAAPVAQAQELPSNDSALNAADAATGWWCQTAGQPRKWPQGWPGQKPQEETCSPAQCSTAATRTAQEGVNAAITSIRARFGDYAIGLGYSGIRFAAPALY